MSRNAAWVVQIHKDWTLKQTDTALTYTYPAPENAKGFYPEGFIQCNDSAADFEYWYGLMLRASTKGNAGMFAAAITVYPADRPPMRVQIAAPVRDGCVQLEIPFADFPCVKAMETVWRFVKAVEIEYDQSQFEITGLDARRSSCVWVDVPVRGLHGDAGEAVTYQGRVCNCTDETIVVALHQQLEGWESMKAEIAVPGHEGTDGILLPAFGEAAFTATVTVHGDMVPGGHEETIIKATGRSASVTGEDLVSLKTLRTLPHPYIYHNAEGWKAVRQKIDTYPCYQPAYQKYLASADNWEVQPPMAGRPFCYETKVEYQIMDTAYAYALTGERRYAEKLARFFRYFTDPENGYPARKRGCSQSYVQEGHFFQHLAIPYDIIHDADVLTDADREAIESTFRLYMQMLDDDVRSGHISNWIISEIQGAIYCAMAIQDMDLIQRFVFGNGGNVEQFRHGVFNDGWWYECSVGYNTWVSSMMIHLAHAMLPFGYNLVHTHFQVPYNKQVGAHRVGEPVHVQTGMFNEKWGGNLKSFARIKDMFDAPVRFLSSRGVLFGMCDSDEKRLGGVHCGSTYDLAYTYYQDPAYIPIIRRMEADPIFGHPAFDQDKPLPETEAEVGGNAYADNIGIMMLRSQKPGRKPSEQIQAVLRYGSHGFAHGHFDIGQLLSIMRYGRSFYNPESCWWGYHHFLYKFYVQCSLTKNMVVVDDKMQVPADSRRILFQSGDKLQAAGIEVTTQWAYPPYGGMCYHERGEKQDADGLRHRLQYNRCDLPVAEGPDAPQYATLSGYTEPIRQRRVMAVLDDYIVVFDAMQGENEHLYDSLMQIRGFRSLEGAKHVGHTEQMSTNIISDAQFITDCNWYEAEGTTVARFVSEFGPTIPRGDRTGHNVPGDLKLDVHTAWPPHTEQMLGRVATDCQGYAVPMDIRIAADGETLHADSLNGWILGRREFTVDVAGRRELTLGLKQGYREDEIGRPVNTPQACFWGSVVLEKGDGTRVELGKLMQENPAAVRMENVDPGCGIGRDYQNGRVTIVGAEYPYAIPASTVDHDQEGTIRLNLEGPDVVRVHACAGVDAFPGSEDQYRRTYAVRTRGQNARFVTVIEPYETESQVQKVWADSADSVTITLRDGTRQTVSIRNMDDGTPEVTLMEE